MFYTDYTITANPTKIMNNLRFKKPGDIIQYSGATRKHPELRKVNVEIELIPVVYTQYQLCSNP